MVAYENMSLGKGFTPSGYMVYGSLYLFPPTKPVRVGLMIGRVVIVDDVPNKYDAVAVVPRVDVLAML